MAIEFLLGVLRVVLQDVLFHDFSLYIFAQKSRLHIAISEDHVWPASALVLNLNNVPKHLRASFHGLGCAP